MPVTQRGGRRYKKHNEQWEKLAKEAHRREVDIGFFSTARYPDGTPVTNVAAWNEFGTETIPERPFFRNAIKDSERDIDELFKQTSAKKIESNEFAAENLLGLVGLLVTENIQKSITNLRIPPNDPATIERKGSENPLIDTGFMRASVTHKVV